MNPNCDVYTAYTGSTEDVQKSKEAAQAMIDKGVDMIGGGGNASNAGMIKACEEAGVYAFGELEQQNLAPETVIFCNMNNIENLVLQAVKDTIDGDFQGCIREYGIAADVAQLTEYNSHVPQEVKDKLAECMDQMRSGELLTLKNPNGSKNLLDQVSFCLHCGEILGVAGVDGNGQNYLAEFLCGIRRQDSQCVSFKNQYIDRLNVRQHFELGISYIPDDRHRDGLILDKSIADNLILRDYRTPKISKFGVVNEKNVLDFARAAIEKFDIRVHGPGERAGNLSGGNQQKIILAREIGDSPDLLIAMQPTRGLDIGASSYVRTCMQNLRDHGKGVLLISTDLDEIMQVSDRIAVMYEGKIMGIVENSAELKAETLGLMMGGRPVEEVIAE